MEKKITLQENIAKLQNCLRAIETLSDQSYRNSTITRVNKRYLRKTVRNANRLNTVIQKQMFEEGLLNRPITSVVLSMYTLFKNSEIDSFTLKRVSKNKYEIWEGNKYAGRFNF